MLDDKIKKSLLNEASKIEIDVSTLPSSKWDKNIYAVEPQYAVGGWDYDENEEWEEQIRELAEAVKIDGLSEYAQIEEEKDYDRSMTEEAVSWLLSLIGE